MARSVERWNSLSPGYRARLIANGVTRHSYVTGKPLIGARGHGRTPERPERATPERYPEYYRKRHPVIGDKFPGADPVYNHVRRMMLDALEREDIERLDLSEVKRYIAGMHPETRAQVLGMTFDEYRSMAKYQQARNSKKPTRAWFVKVDGEWVNPFWYH